MSMREAFEKYYVNNYAGILPIPRRGDGYSDGETSSAWYDFKAGFTAAIEAVKAGGAVAYEDWSDSEQEFQLTRRENKFAMKQIPLYKLPEDV